MKDFDFGAILNNHLKLILCPKGTGEVIGKIKYLLMRYLRSKDLQYLISDYQFFKYFRWLDENRNEN